METFDRITFDPQIMGGRACIRGMRIPVSVVVGQIAHGATFDEILADYPDLESEDVKQAIGYAAWLAQRGHIGPGLFLQLIHARLLSPSIRQKQFAIMPLVRALFYQLS